LILDVCYSGASSHRAARAQVGLEQLPTRHPAGDAAALTGGLDEQDSALVRRVLQLLGE